jgi:hypothetical protein
MPRKFAHLVSNHRVATLCRNNEVAIPETEETFTCAMLDEMAQIGASEKEVCDTLLTLAVSGKCCGRVS